jgi:hypothetical protein
VVLVGRRLLHRSAAVTAARAGSGKAIIAGAIIMPPVSYPGHTMPGHRTLVNPASQAALQRQLILQFRNNVIPISTIKLQAGLRG